MLPHRGDDGQPFSRKRLHQLGQLPRRLNWGNISGIGGCSLAGDIRPLFFGSINESNIYMPQYSTSNLYELAWLTKKVFENPEIDY